MGFWRQNDGYKNVRKIIPLFKSYGRQKDEPRYKNDYGKSHVIKMVMNPVIKMADRIIMNIPAIDSKKQLQKGNDAKTLCNSLI